MAAADAAPGERISLVSANGSGCEGAGCLRFMNREAETIAAITRTFPFWFRSSFADFAGREEDLPVDLHDLKALVSPRPLLVTYGYDDHWANLARSLLTHEATLPAYALHGAEDLCTLHFREGAHYHGIEDWTRLIDFADHHWFGKPTPGHYPLNEASQCLKQEPLIDSSGNAFGWPASPSG